jgi:RimJ/RimL family protein N-acetyltransferase
MSGDLRQIEDEIVGQRLQSLTTTLVGERCKLTPLGPQHTRAVVKWRNDPQIARHFLTDHRFEIATHEAWLARARSTNRDFNWAIEDDIMGPVGTVGLYDVDWRANRAEFGRLLVGEQKARGRGLAREACRMVLTAASRAGLQTIYLDVKASNTTAHSIYQRAGFANVASSDGLIRMCFECRQE